MDNYLQINYRRVLKGVDFGTFYKVAKSRPEILDILTAYEFDNNQIKQIVQAFVDGLTIEQIKSCATPDFEAVQMLWIYSAYKSGLNVEQMALVVNPAFCYLQMKWIIRGIQNGWKKKLIKLYASVEFEADQMEEIYLAIQDGLDILKIKLFAKPKFSAQQMKVLRLAFCSFEAELEYEEVEVIANHKFSVVQMEKLVDAYNYGLTIKQVKEIAKENYSPAQLQEIIEAYTEGYTDEQMAFILNPKLDNLQMGRIHMALENGLTNAEIASFAISVYDFEHMEIIIEAYKYGVKSYVDLLLNPELDVSQADTIWKICKLGLLSIEQIKFLAKEENDGYKMDEIAEWFKDNFSIEQLQEYVDEFDAEQLEIIRYGLKNKIKHSDLYINPEFDASQMKEIIYGIENGLTRKQLLLFADPLKMPCLMAVIREDIEAGVPLKKVALYANCDGEKIEQIRFKVLYEEIQKLIR